MTTAAQGIVALIGAGEYLPTMVSVDKMLLEQLGSTPHVAVLSTAAVPDGSIVAERWLSMGIEYFSQIGVNVEAVRLFTREDANNPTLAAQLNTANFIYFSGGKPRYLLETLQNTPAWQAIKDIFTSGGVVAGCSAGAMVLGGSLFDFPQVWRTLPALELVPGIAVVPHFNELPPMIADNVLRLAHTTTVVGIDAATALVWSQRQWTVQGSGGVTVFTDEQRSQRYKAGEFVLLPPLY
jgi:cyanophycinase